MEKYLINDVSRLYHIAIVASISYVVLFTFIRIAGKRSLAKLNAFDFIVTITLGSTLSSMILAQVPIAEGAVALATILFLQFILAKAAKDSKTMEKVINSSPTILFYDGKFLRDNMAKEIVTEEEIYSQIRKFRIERISDVKAVIMELTGELTVVKKSPGGEYSSLDDLNTDRLSDMN